MKNVIMMGVCALFLACNSSSKEVNKSDTTVAIVADTSMVSVAALDTSNLTSVSSVEPSSAVAASPEKPVVRAVEVKPKEVSTVKTIVSDPVADDKEDIKKGEILISKSDCFACHKPNEKLLGPSYQEVAGKYKNTKENIDMLVNKIKVGGSGVWGAIPMSPHPAISDDDARSMVLYILSLK